MNSGKTTLLHVLLQLTNPSTGTITIDSINISTLAVDEIRRNIIAIPQDPYILPGTVRRNADPHHLASDEEIISVLSRNEIGLWDALANRGGLDAVLEQQPLSLGQAQLFALARAILVRRYRYRDTSPEQERTGRGGKAGGVLILDEATSNLDADSDRRVQRFVKEEFRGYTILSVAHSVSLFSFSARFPWGVGLR